MLEKSTIGQISMTARVQMQENGEFQGTYSFETMGNTIEGEVDGERISADVSQDSQPANMRQMSDMFNM
ncbi:MAG: hypothetical protein HQM12_23410 [SAR324 cluster bacterium]|nr:hypothetical protein [SAR324 cluster bacterium]